MYSDETAVRTGTHPILEPQPFGSILDETCERLMDRQILYSIRRIGEMEARLRDMEEELGEFLEAR